MLDREGMGRSSRLAALAIVAGVVVACSSPSGPDSCAGGEAALPGNICLVLGPSGEFEPHRAVIEEEVERTLAAVRTRLDVTDLRIAFRPELSGVIPEVGIGGFNPSAEEVRIYLDPANPGLDSIVRDELLRILSHEIHHALRRRTVGYGSTLFQAAVTEGLADHFALEVGGGEPAPWSVALTPEELEEWMLQVLAGTAPGYDHGAWFLGTSPSIPRWTGYAVGFELVGVYLNAHPGSSASGLVGEPADSFR